MGEKVILVGLRTPPPVPREHTHKTVPSDLQKATILENDYEDASASLSKKFNTTADARERAAKLAAKADRILQATLKQKGDLQGEGVVTPLLSCSVLSCSG